LEQFTFQKFGELIDSDVLFTVEWQSLVWIIIQSLAVAHNWHVSWGVNGNLVLNRAFVIGSLK
jgi:hypothetical protein